MLFLLGILFSLILIELWGSLYIIRPRISERLIKVKSLQKLRITVIDNAYDYYKKQISNERWVCSQDIKQKYIGALNWVVSRVKKRAPCSVKEPVALLKAVESGEGTNCFGMAILFQNTLSAIGLPSRIVELRRNMHDRYDAHTTIEVLLDNKWVVFDPTFNISFADSNGGLLSAQDIKEHLLSGRYAEVRPLSYGRSAYPCTSTNYYISYLSLCNNVFVSDSYRQGYLVKLPPFRYWLGPKLFYEQAPLKTVTESISHLEFDERLYFIFNVILPILTFIVTVIIIVWIFLLNLQ